MNKLLRRDEIRLPVTSGGTLLAAVHRPKVKERPRKSRASPTAQLLRLLEDHTALLAREGGLRDWIVGSAFLGLRSAKREGGRRTRVPEHEVEAGTLVDLTDDWSRPYTRAQACFPLKSLRTDKYLSPVNRVDNIYGDRNLVCACPPIEDYAAAE